MNTRKEHDGSEECRTARIAMELHDEEGDQRKSYRFTSLLMVGIKEDGTEGTAFLSYDCQIPAIIAGLKHALKQSPKISVDIGEKEPFTGKPGNA